MMIAFYTLIFLLGLCFGSFINAWLWRVRMGIPIYNARSECPNCKNRISWYDNIPLLSFIFLIGKCRRCHKKISWQYPIVELTTGLFFLIVAIFSGANIGLSSSAGIIDLTKNLYITFFLVCIFVYDFKYQEILDRFTLIPAAPLLLYNLYRYPDFWVYFLISILIGTGFFLLQLIVSKGRWLGGGDVRMGFFMGVALGAPAVVFFAILTSYVIGAVVAIYLILMQKKGMKSEVPLGTFLAIGTFIAMIFPSLTSYLSASIL